MAKVAPYSIVWQDKHILVVDKISGISVLPERWEKDQENILDLVRQTWPEAIAVHRIDKETSGLLLMALDADSARQLQIDFEGRKIGKLYHAIAVGRPSWNDFICASPLLIDADRLHRSQVCSATTPLARNCESRFSVKERYRSQVFLEVEPLSGRTHQIRAHAASIGFPLVGDHLYGGPKDLRLSSLKSSWKGDKFDEQPLIARVALHAWRLVLRHPITQENLDFCADYPKDLKATLAQLNRLR